MKLVLLIMSIVIINNCTKVPNLNIGKKDLSQEIIEHKKLGDGIEYFKVLRGNINETENITIISTIIDEDEANIAKEKLSSLNLENIEILDLPELSPSGKSLGKIISIDFTNEEEAELMLPKIKASYPNNFSIRFKSENGYPTNGPYDISILEIDLNKYKGDIKSALAKGKIKSLDTTTSIAESHNKITGEGEGSQNSVMNIAHAINGGYFVFNESIGTTGDLAGISVINGTLVSEARNGSPALYIKSINGENSADIFGNVKTYLSFSVNGESYVIDGVNRKLGRSFGGGNIGDTPTDKPVHDMLTTDDTETILYNSYYGSSVEIGTGEIAYKLVNGKIVEQKMSGSMYIENDDTVVLKLHRALISQFKTPLTIGDDIIVDIKVTSNDAEIILEEGVYIVNGGPSLLVDGKMTTSNRASEGWDDSLSAENEVLDAKDSVATGGSTDRKDFYYGWVLRRHPRTAIGITKDNKLISVVVYGRDYKKTVGASITEMGEILKSLGAYKAINLDGGGSSMMIIEGERTGKSSDASGERAVGDAIIFVK